MLEKHQTDYNGFIYIACVVYSVTWGCFQVVSLRNNYGFGSDRSISRPIKVYSDNNSAAFTPRIRNDHPIQNI